MTDLKRRFKLKLKVTHVEGLQCEGPVAVTCTLLTKGVMEDSKKKDTLVSDFVETDGSGTAVWEDGNSIADLSLVQKKTCLLSVAVTDENVEILGEAQFDVVPYISEVEPGEKKKIDFSLTTESNLEEKVRETTSVAASTPGKPNAPVTVPTISAQTAIVSEKKSPRAERDQDKKKTPRTELKDPEKSPREEDHGTPPKTEKNRTSVPASSLKPEQKLTRKQSTEKPKEAVINSVSLASPRAEVVIPRSHIRPNQTFDVTRSNTLPLNMPEKTPEKTILRAEISSPQRLVEESKKKKIGDSKNPDSASKPGKLGEKSKPTSSRGHKKVEESKSQNSSGRTSKKEVDVDQLKKELASRQKENDENFLLNEFIPSQTPSEYLVSALVIFKSLVHWHAFTKNTSTPPRIVQACHRSMKTVEGSRTMLFHWLSTFVGIHYLASNHRTTLTSKSGKKESTEILDDFLENIYRLASVVFENLGSLLIKRCDAAIKSSFLTVLCSPAGSDKSLPTITEALNQIFSFLSGHMEHFVFDQVRKQFLQRTATYFSSTLIDVLIRQDTAHSHGIQIKMILTVLENWARSKLGVEFGQQIYDDLEPARQAANVLCLQAKSHLADASVRQTVCPSLRPELIHGLLKNYKFNYMFDAEPVPPVLLTKFLQLDQTFVETKSTFKLFVFNQLSLNFYPATLDIGRIVIPKVVVDRFSFLKASTSEGEARSEKW